MLSENQLQFRPPKYPNQKDNHHLTSFALVPLTPDDEQGFHLSDNENDDSDNEYNDSDNNGIINKWMKTITQGREDNDGKMTTKDTKTLNQNTLVNKSRLVSLDQANVDG